MLLLHVLIVVHSEPSRGVKNAHQLSTVQMNVFPSPLRGVSHAPTAQQVAVRGGDMRGDGRGEHLGGQKVERFAGHSRPTPVKVGKIASVAMPVICAEVQRASIGAASVASINPLIIPVLKV